MMQLIRDHAHGWFVTILLGAICIPFAFWGVQSYIDAAVDTSIAHVGDATIDQREYLEAVERARSMVEAEMGEQANKLDLTALKRRVLDGMIQQRLLAIAASQGKLRVGDGMILREITTMEPFMKDGVFSPELYADRLRNTAMTRRGFEEQLREEMLSQQFRAGLVQTALVVPVEAEAVRQLVEQRRNIRFAQWSVDAIAKNLTVDDTQLQAYFAEHRDSYLSEPQVDVDYLELRANDLLGSDEPEAEVLETLYEESKARYTQAEERRVRHILLEVKADADAAAIAAAQEKAQSLRERLDAGEDFAALATAESNDVASAKQGGDLGWFGRGVMDPAFEAAAFALAEGELSVPVRSSFGFHLIKVQEIRPESTRSFADVRADLVTAWRQDKAQQAFFSELEKLEVLAFERGSDLESVADELGLEFKHALGLSSTTAEGVLKNPKVLARALDTDLARTGEASEIIDLGNNHVVVLRVIKRKEPEPLEFTAAKARVEVDYRNATARQQAKDQAEQLLQNLRATNAPDFALLTQPMNVKLIDLGAVTRAHPELPRAAARLAFRAALPDANAVQYATTVLGNGNAVLVEVKAAQADATSPKEPANAVLERWTEDARKRQAEADWEFLMADLRRQTDISINENQR